jgi:predicted phosphohydrolase
MFPLLAILRLKMAAILIKIHYNPVSAKGTRSVMQEFMTMVSYCIHVLYEVAEEQCAELSIKRLPPPDLDILTLY